MEPAVVAPSNTAPKKPRFQDDEGGDESEGRERTASTERVPRKKERTRIGRPINKADDEGFELVFDILLGIRNTVSRTEAKLLPDKAQLSEFRVMVREKYPSRGSQTTPAHSNRDFTFYDFCPTVFRRIRALFGIDAADYLLSLTAEYQLSEIISPGKSKSFFYFSWDMKYMLKTLYSFEADFLRKILVNYYEHLCHNPNTLLVRFLGFHAVKPHKGPVRYFIVMNNVFTDNLDIHAKYDLKGSTYGRTAFEHARPEKDADVSSIIQKDLDFNRRFQLGPEKRKAFLAQLLIDSDFLDRLNIMDYSLLVGIHSRDRGNPKTRMRRSTISLVKPQLDVSAGSGMEGGGNNNNNSVIETAVSSAVASGFESDIESMSPSPAVDKNRICSIFEKDDGGFCSTDEDNSPLSEVYYMGIIDILQPYNFSKKVESRFKGTVMRIPKAQLSAVGPHLYCRRFQDYIVQRTGPGPVINLREEARKGVLKRTYRLSKELTKITPDDESDRFVLEATGIPRNVLLKEYMAEQRVVAQSNAARRKELQLQMLQARQQHAQNQQKRLDGSVAELLGGLLTDNTNGSAAGTAGVAKAKEQSEEEEEEVEIDISHSLSLDSDGDKVEPSSPAEKKKANGAADAPQAPDDEYSYL